MNTDNKERFGLEKISLQSECPRFLYVTIIVQIN